MHEKANLTSEFIEKKINAESHPDTGTRMCPGKSLFWTFVKCVGAEELISLVMLLGVEKANSSRSLANSIEFHRTIIL